VRIGIVTFPGSLDDGDAARAVRRVGAEPVSLWHADAELHGVDAVILPGGFSYGDYLRPGAIASHAPVMTEVVAAANRGTPVLGICNGFQILTEAGLLPGALVRNENLRFVCRDQWLRVENNTTAFSTRFDAGAEILVPVKSSSGCYVAEPDTLRALADENRVVFRYVGTNPNGSSSDIAGISDPSGRIVGMMPHAEHAVDALTGPSDDGLGVFYSALDALADLLQAS